MTTRRTIAPTDELCLRSTLDGETREHIILRRSLPDLMDLYSACAEQGVAVALTVEPYTKQKGGN